MTRKSYLLKVTIALTLSLIMTFLLMMPSLANSATESGDAEDPYRVESFHLDGPGDLDVETSGGHITVEGSSTNTMRVEMFVRKNGKELTPEDTDLDDWDVSISQSGNSVQVIAKRNGRTWNSWGDNISISFTIYSPQEISTNLKTSGGHIKSENLIGSQRIATSGGHLELSDIQGEVEAKTSGGHINIRNIKGATQAKTSGGHIDAENIEGNLNIRTSGGHIKLATVSGSVEARTSGGSIDADLATIDSFVNLRTSGGNVNVTVPNETGLNLNLRGSYVNAQLSNFSGEIEHDEVLGELHGGGPELSARTSGGVVSLAFH